MKRIKTIIVSMAIIISEEIIVFFLIDLMEIIIL
jgi:hypothetical protein